MRLDFEVPQVAYKGEKKDRRVYNCEEFEDSYLMENNRGELTMISDNGNKEKKKAWVQVEKELEG